MRIGLISGGYPPDLDGIGDYTHWLARSLVGSCERPVVVFTSLASGRIDAPGVEVLQFFDPSRPASFRGLLDYPAVNDLDWLVLQYNPFSFGRRGFCPWVPETLALLKQRQKKPRVAVMFHETTVPRWPWRFAIMYCWQQPIFRRICHLADVAFVSTERWLPQVLGAAPETPVYHLPVGSNIPLSEVSRNDARRSFGLESDALILGIFGSTHASKRLDWIGATVKASQQNWPNRRVALLYVGAEGGILRSSLPNSSFIDAGRLPPEAVGPHLRAMDAVISPFSDGISTRRTSVISVLHHGVPVATTRTPFTDKLFISDAPSGVLLSAANSAEAFASEVVDWLKTNSSRQTPDSEVVAFYKSHFQWSAICAKLLGRLR